jgi:hypothetical protein
VAASIGASITRTVLRAAPETNALEICVVAPKRSGHHAIVEWILRHLDGNGCFFNNCKAEPSPYTNLAGARTKGIDLEHERPGNYSPKAYLVHSYENRSLAKVFSPDRLERWDDLVGTSQRRVHLMVLRDPFNNFASLVRWGRDGEDGPSPETLRVWVERWKTYAREYLGMTDFMPPEKIGFSYNAWFTEQHERRKLADTLGLDFSDEGIDEVTAWGASRGSSFDGLSYDGRAREMGVLERFRSYEDDAFYRSLFDPEIIDLSERIFGEVPGTERIVASARGSSRPGRPGVRFWRRLRSSSPPAPSRTDSRS